MVTTGRKLTVCVTSIGAIEMIPHRARNNEIVGHALKGRVTACRKRLRVNRSGHRVHSDDPQVAFVAKTAAVFPDDYSAVRESYVSRRAAPEFDDGKAWDTGEQEVGIT